MGQNAFAVIREETRDKVALARVGLARRERVIMLQARDKGLMGTTLPFKVAASCKPYLNLVAWIPRCLLFTASPGCIFLHPPRQPCSPDPASGSPVDLGAASMANFSFRRAPPLAIAAASSNMIRPLSILVALGFALCCALLITDARRDAEAQAVQTNAN